MSTFDFNTLFLDTGYKDILERYCIRQGLIDRNIYDGEKQSAEELEVLKAPLTGIKKLLIWLTLFEYVDSNSSVYDFSKLVDLGMVKESSSLCESDGYLDRQQKEYINVAVELMKIYKYDVIKHIKNKDKQELLSLQTYAESRDFWRTIKRSQRQYFCADVQGNLLNLEKNYNEIVEDADNLYSATSSLESIEAKLAFGLIWNRDIALDVGSIRDNLAECLYHSESEKITFASSLFTHMYQPSNIDIIDSIYYVVQAHLPNEVNIMPMPQNLKDVIEMRNSPYMKAFRSVIKEWSNYLDNGEYKLAEKMKKDIIKANQRLDQLQKYKRFSSSPYIRTFNMIGGQIPYLGNVLGILDYVEPFVINHIQKKNGWVLMTKN